MAADDTRHPSSTVDDLPEGVERIGDLTNRYIQEHLTPMPQRLDTERVTTTTPPLATTKPSRGNGTSGCPHCAGERSRFYRPGVAYNHQQIASPEEAAELLVPMLQGLDREHCISLNLDTRQRLVGVSTISIGSLDHTFMSPREVFRDALLHGAAAIVLAHNHPSGDPEPSRDDELITRRLHKAGDIVGIDVLDHMVIGHRRWASLARRGVLMERPISTELDRPAEGLRRR